jgi:hypothetical protein
VTTHFPTEYVRARTVSFSRVEVWNRVVTWSRALVHPAKHEGTHLTVTILSLSATARIAERHVRQHGPTSRDALITWLQSVDVARDRAEAGLRLAEISGRLELAPDDDGAPAYRLPQRTEQAA